jgi:hypothetical protein
VVGKPYGLKLIKRHVDFRQQRRRHSRRLETNATRREGNSAATSRSWHVPAPPIRHHYEHMPITCQESFCVFFSARFFTHRNCHERRDAAQPWETTEPTTGFRIGIVCRKPIPSARPALASATSEGIDSREDQQQMSDENQSGDELG